MKKDNSGNYAIYRQRHVTRHAARHLFELDDYLYGSPLPKQETDWALLNPTKYLEDLEDEREVLKELLGDLQCVLIAHGELKGGYSLAQFTQIEANAHVPHKFKFRDFTYAEKISHLLTSMNPAEIPFNIAKGMRQFNVLIAAIEDIDVSLIRYRSYVDNLKEEKE